MKYIKRFFCWMGWHSFFSGYESVKSKDPTGFLTYARCPWSKYEGMVDSQGNLF